MGLVEKSELNEELFLAVYPNNDAIKTAEDFKNEVKAEIERYYAQSARSQVQDQIYHYLVDHIHIEFPENLVYRRRGHIRCLQRSTGFLCAKTYSVRFPWTSSIVELVTTIRNLSGFDDFSCLFIEKHRMSKCCFWRQLLS